MAPTRSETSAIDPPDDFSAASALHRANRTAEALAAYDAVLAGDPWHVGALLQAGSLALQTGQSYVAASHYQSLLNLDDDEIGRALEKHTVDLKSGLGFAALCENNDRPALALSVTDTMQANYPDSADAKMAFGKLLFDQGRKEDAILQFRLAADLSDDSSNSWAALGTVYLQARLPEQAQPAFERAVEIDPDDHEARCALAGVIELNQNPLDALRHYRQLAVRVEADGDILRTVALKLLAGGDTKNAQIAYTKLLKQDIDDYSAALGLGAVFLAARQPDDAIGYLQHALSRLPADAESLMDLARRYANYLPRSITNVLLVQAVDAARDDPDQLSEIAQIVYHARFGRAALNGLLRLYEIAPDDPNLLPALVDTKLSMCDWGGSQSLIDEVLTSVDTAIANRQPLNMDVWNLFAIGVDYPTLARAARYKSKQIYDQCATSRAHLNFTFKPLNRDRIRIGYMCPYTWRSSHIANLMTVVRQHDRNRFELFGYAIQDGDDEFCVEFRSMFDTFRHTPLDELDNSAQRIYDDEIDILIDSTGHFAATCIPLAAMRPAPVIVHGTAGFNIIGAAEFYDYSLNDRQFLTDDLVDLYIEKPFYVPNCAMPAELLPIEELPDGRGYFDIPEDRFVFADFNHSCKYDPKVFAAWMEILRRVPDSVLLLCQWLDDASINLHRLAEQHGVSSDRVIFAPVQRRSAHLRRLQLCDLALDTFYHCGGVTTVDCLIVGLPILTALPDRRLPLANRSLLAAMDCEDLVMPDLASYVEKAVELANDPAQLAEIRARMWENRARSPLFQAERWVRNLERALDIIHRNRCDGADPAPFSVLDVEDWPSH